MLYQAAKITTNEFVKKAAALDAKNVEIRYHLAVASAKSGDKASARRELEALLESPQQFPDRKAAEVLLKQL